MSPTLASALTFLPIQKQAVPVAEETIASGLKATETLKAVRAELAVPAIPKAQPTPNIQRE